MRQKVSPQPLQVALSSCQFREGVAESLSGPEAVPAPALHALANLNVKVMQVNSPAYLSRGWKTWNDLKMSLWIIVLRTR